MVVNYVCIISASIVWYNVEYVKGRLCTKHQLNVLSSYMGTQHIVRSAYELQKRRALKICICKYYSDAVMSTAAATCAIELRRGI